MMTISLFMGRRPVSVLFSAVWLFLISLAVSSAAETPEQAAKEEAFRAKLAPGGDFTPKPEEGVFVAAGHGLNVVASRDDGKTWQPVFAGFPGGDHGRWAVWNSVAYTEGVFAIAAGWGAPGTIVASDDGQNWRHLAAADRKPTAKGTNSYDMKTTMELLGVRGSFIMPLQATPDFGRTWHEASAYGFRDAAGNRVKIDIGHPSLAYSTYGGGRIVVIGDMGPGLVSDDLGKTWTPLQVKAEPWPDGGAKGIIALGDVFLIVKGDGAQVLRSTDGGQTWTAHPLGVRRPLGRSFGLSVVNGEIWVTGENARASRDGVTWRDLPATTPAGRFDVSDTGTIINVDRKRTSILRSTDGERWEEVFRFTPPPEASGGAQGLADVAFGRVKRSSK